MHGSAKKRQLQLVNCAELSAQVGLATSSILTQVAFVIDACFQGSWRGTISMVRI
ncbi:hypothetical protein FH972_022601 [Carpinus fangiana]|uniref:Uncharacterized protein n=1 Tax=Carpinus fangiana TaxID=176857 RepID=A0A5N6KSQ4_9ROSI|nr:hypothetical protein FH972_022601 [Carpinus fangiana]